MSDAVDPQLAARLRGELAALDRRGFLRLVGVAAGAGLLPSGCGADAARFGPPAGTALRALTPRTYAVCNAAAERIVGERGAAAIRARTIDPAERIDAFLASSPELVAPVRQALLALEFAMPPLSGRLPPFSALGDAARDAVLADCLHSRLALRRQLFNGVRTFAALGFYGSRASRALIGYPQALGRGEPSIEDAMRYPDTPDFPGPGARG